MLLCFLIFFFFFFKQKTAYEMRISDWSSDVCSSDLDDGSDYGDQISGTRPQASPGSHCATVRLAGHCRDARQVGHGGEAAKLYRGGPSLSVLLAESGRIGGGTGLADRTSGVVGKGVSVRVDHGGRRIIKKKKIK